LITTTADIEASYQGAGSDVVVHHLRLVIIVVVMRDHHRTCRRVGRGEER